MAEYSNLFKEITLRNTVVKNRIAMSAMNENMAHNDGSVTDQQIAYFEERARGGVGMIITGNAFVDEEASQVVSGQMGVYSDKLVPGLARLAERVKLYGAVMIMQISHAGRQTFLPWKRPLLAPSAVASFAVGEVPKEMTLEDIQKVKDNFVAAALRAKQAGFDGVEVHCGHGYLLSEFISPNSNKRTDSYGSSQENRMRLPLEIIREMREKAGNYFIIGVKFNAREQVENGITKEEGMEIAKILAKEDIDYLNVSAGTYESADEQCQSFYLPMSYNVDLAEAVKRAVNVPVIAVGSINEPEQAEEIVASGKADMVAMGRQLIIDPGWPEKVLEGREREIRGCIRCNVCQGRLPQNKNVVCSVNPEVGKEMFYEIVPAKISRRVVVVGGGPAGMEAARVCALRGHKVVLLEAGDDIGGVSITKKQTHFKEDLLKMNKYFKYELQRLGVEIKLNYRGNEENVMALNPDVVIVATGGKLKKNPYSGDNTNVVQALDYLNENASTGDRVAIVGAGLVGCETALELSREGKKPVIITSRPANDAASRINVLTRSRLLIELGKAGVQFVDVARVKEIGPKGPVVTRGGGEETVEADTVALARGFSPNTELYDKLKVRGIEVYAVGDCKGSDSIRVAVEQGSFAARQI